MRRLAWAVCVGLTACGTAPAPATHQPLGSGTLTVAADFDGPITRVGNTLRITVSDDQGAPVAGAAVAVSATMASHGHDAQPPGVRAVGGGAYAAGPLAFPMAGRWAVQVRAVREADEGARSIEVVVP